jgi:hypothetical protein
MHPLGALQGRFCHKSMRLRTKPIGLRPSAVWGKNGKGLNDSPIASPPFSSSSWSPSVLSPDGYPKKNT